MNFQYAPRPPPARLGGGAPIRRNPRPWSKPPRPFASNSHYDDLGWGYPPPRARSLINTPIHGGGRRGEGVITVFNGFGRGAEIRGVVRKPLETVALSLWRRRTPMNGGVKETGRKLIVRIAAPLLGMPRTASRAHQHRVIHLFGRKLKAGPNVFRLQKGVILQDLSHPRGQHLQHILHPQPVVPDARTPAAPLGVERDAFCVLHARTVFSLSRLASSPQIPARPLAPRRFDFSGTTLPSYSVVFDLHSPNCPQRSLPTSEFRAGQGTRAGSRRREARGGDGFVPASCSRGPEGRGDEAVAAPFLDWPWQRTQAPTTSSAAKISQAQFMPAALPLLAPRHRPGPDDPEHGEVHPDAPHHFLGFKLCPPAQCLLPTTFSASRSCQASRPRPLRQRTPKSKWLASQIALTQHSPMQTALADLTALPTDLAKLLTDLANLRHTPLLRLMPLLLALPPSSNRGGPIRIRSH